MRSRFVKSGFSLVEVVIALGVISFCIVAVIGTLSTGYQSNRDSLARGEATRMLGSVSSSLRAAYVTNGMVASSDPFNLSWSVGGVATNYTFLSTEENAITTDLSAARQSVGISIQPPATPDKPSTASIVVAWPGSAQIAWSGQAPTVTKAEGYVTLYLYLNAK